MKFNIDLISSIKKESKIFSSLLTNNIIRWTGRATILLIVAGILLLIFSWNKLPTEIPIWYSKPWGSDRLASPYWLAVLPGASFLWFMINALLSMHVTKEHLVFSQILFISSLVVSMFSLSTLIMIIWIIS